MSKALAVAKYLLEKANASGYQLTPMQLLKLVYVAHGWMLGRYRKPLFPESVEAWQYGPVVPVVYQAIKGYGSNPVGQVYGANSGNFDSQEIDIMDFVINTYGKVNGIALSTATHNPGTPWSQTWNGCSSAISNDLIQNFYESISRLPTHSSL